MADRDEMDWHCTKNQTTPQGRWTSLKNTASGDHTPVSSRLTDILEEGSSNQFSVLPKYMECASTDASPRRNPFEMTLLNRLHRPTISPSIFSRILSPSQDTENFSWSIEDVAVLKPAPIEECPLKQQDVVLDPDQEARAQEAIDNYFLRHHVVPSPCPWLSRVMHEKHSSSPNVPVPVYPSKMVCASTQTTLSFPRELPVQLEEALNAVLSAIRAWEEGDSDNTYVPTLRRKLHFHEVENDAVDSLSLSPMGSTDSPCQMLFPSTPKVNGRGYEPLVDISPPEISPISKMNNYCRPSSPHNLTVDMSIDYADTSQSHMSKPNEKDDGAKVHDNHQTYHPSSTRMDNFCTADGSKQDTGYQTYSSSSLENYTGDFSKHDGGCSASSTRLEKCNGDSSNQDTGHQILNS